MLQGTETWTNVTYDLGAYAGQTVRVEFLVHQDGAGDVAHMYVDDVMVIEPCNTPTPATDTPTATQTHTPTQTNTPTRHATMVATSTLGASPTPVAPTPCPIQFSDVPEGSTFYVYVRCLACRGIVSGYGDGTFRPNNNVTRGQLSKIVSNAAGFGIPRRSDV